MIFRLVAQRELVFRPERTFFRARMKMMARGKRRSTTKKIMKVFGYRTDLKDVKNVNIVSERDAEEAAFAVRAVLELNAGVDP